MMLKALDTINCYYKKLTINHSIVNLNFARKSLTLFLRCMLVKIRILERQKHIMLNNIC